MKIDSLTRSLVALKKTIPAVLLLGSLSFGLAPNARAQFTITMTENAAQTQTTIQYGGTGPSPWDNLNTETREAEGRARTGQSVDQEFFNVFAPGIIHDSGRAQDYTLSGDYPLSGATNFYATSVSGAGGFKYWKAGGLFEIYSTADHGSGVLQWSGSATYTESFASMGISEGVGSFTFTNPALDNVVVNWTASAVPEPSAYSALLGIFTLVFVGLSRRTRHSKEIQKV